MLARVTDAHLDTRPAKHGGATSPTSHAPPGVKRGASIGSPTCYDSRVCCCEHALIQHKHDNDDGSPASSAGRRGETRVCASSKKLRRWCQPRREQHARSPPLLLCIRCARSLTYHKVSKNCACDLASAKRERLSVPNAAPQSCLPGSPTTSYRAGMPCRGPHRPIQCWSWHRCCAA